MHSLPPELLDQFQELIYGRTSLRFSPSRQINLEIQLKERTAACGFATCEDYFQYLLSNPREMEALVEGITTKETYFFRLPGQLEALRDKVIPGLEQVLSEKAQTGRNAYGNSGAWEFPLRIWSAGCATGEEAYSIAMAVMEGLQYPRAWHVDILATDISQDALMTAERGYYEYEALEQIPIGYRVKYVTSVNGTGGYISPVLRKTVTFRVFNLRDLVSGENQEFSLTGLNGSQERMNLAGYFDIIFCRNVMIYFDFEAQQGLVNGLYACLKPGGYLFTGDAELLHIYEHSFQAAEYMKTYFYQKPEA